MSFVNRLFRQVVTTEDLWKSVLERYLTSRHTIFEQPKNGIKLINTPNVGWKKIKDYLFGDTNTACVSLGSQNLRIGSTGNPENSMTLFHNMLRYEQNKNGYLCGITNHDFDFPNLSPEFGEEVWAMRDGVIVDWDAQQYILEAAFRRIGIDLTLMPLVIGHSPALSWQYIQRLQEFLFESIGSPAAQCCIKPFASSLASGRAHGTFVYSGHQETSLVTILEGQVLSSTLRSNFGGVNIDEKLVQLIEQKSGTRLDSREISNVKKQNLLPDTPFTLPDAKTVQISTREFEGLYESAIPKEFFSALKDFHLNVPIDQRRDMTCVVSGGNQEAATHYLKQVKWRTAPYPWKPLSFTTPLLGCYEGISVAASLSTYRNCFVTRSLYDEGFSERGWARIFADGQADTAVADTINEFPNKPSERNHVMATGSCNCHQVECSECHESMKPCELVEHNLHTKCPICSKSFPSIASKLRKPNEETLNSHLPKCPQYFVACPFLFEPSSTHAAFYKDVEPDRLTPCKEESIHISKLPEHLAKAHSGHAGPWIRKAKYTTGCILF